MGECRVKGSGVQGKWFQHCQLLVLFDKPVASTLANLFVAYSLNLFSKSSSIVCNSHIRSSINHLGHIV